MPFQRLGMLSLSLLLLLPVSLLADNTSEDVPIDTVTGRRPRTEDDLKYWVRSCLGYHHFSLEETALALDMTPEEVSEVRLGGWSDIYFGIRIMPYPGGRHPRIGFLDGAIDPQRETKVTVFTPWQPEGEERADYVVVDVPEAIWSNLGLTYLAHTHVPTIWTMQGIELEPLEWDRSQDGVLSLERTLPNGIAFTSTVTSHRDHVDMQMTLTNGTDATLSDLRVQNCVMLKAAEGFNQQTNDNKYFRDHYVAVHDESGERWIITAWLPLHRGWANAPCPCLHSDPQFPDCEPGETQTIHGWLSFYEGTDIDAELDRIEMLKWWE